MTEKAPYFLQFKRFSTETSKTYFKARNFCGMKTSRFQLQLSSENRKIKMPQRKFLDQNKKIKC